MPALSIATRSRRNDRGGRAALMARRSERSILQHFDWLLFSFTLALAAVGVVSVISASYTGPHSRGLDPLAIRQLIWIAVGSGILAVAALVDYRSLEGYAYPFYGAAVGLLAIVMVAGHAMGGSRRWINLGFFHLEPSEVAKLAVVLVMARYLREEPPKGGWRLRQMIIPFLLFAVPAALVFKQPDLGTGLILALVATTLIFVSGLNWRMTAAVALAAVLAAPIGWRFMKPYQRQRLVSFMNPQADPLGAGYHIIQSEIAI
ncbi:MAG TPA: FtsW/RodA/SpoVE family cell cycle protein, partial [Candidatus Binataceae bacterium]|nr:FtsW/RodA/SpoVE family cell cycle protein [Candidatus Binataceae bacterium]